MVLFFCRLMKNARESQRIVEALLRMEAKEGNRSMNEFLKQKELEEHSRQLREQSEVQNLLHGSAPTHRQAGLLSHTGRSLISLGEWLVRVEQRQQHSLS
jgi:hypothetical protein